MVNKRTYCGDRREDEGDRGDKRDGDKMIKTIVCIHQFPKASITFLYSKHTLVKGGRELRFS